MERRGASEDGRQLRVFRSEPCPSNQQSSFGKKRLRKSGLLVPVAKLEGEFPDRDVEDGVELQDGAGR